MTTQNGTNGAGNKRPTRIHFRLGQMLATPGALDVLERHGVSAATALLARHAAGDWGEIVRHVTHLFQVR